MTEFLFDHKMKVSPEKLYLILKRLLRMERTGDLAVKRNILDLTSLDLFVDEEIPITSRAGVSCTVQERSLEFRQFVVMLDGQPVGVIQVKVDIDNGLNDVKIWIQPAYESNPDARLVMSNLVERLKYELPGSIEGERSKGDSIKNKELDPIDQACIDWVRRSRSPHKNMDEFLEEFFEIQGKSISKYAFKNYLQDAEKRGIIRRSASGRFELP